MDLVKEMEIQGNLKTREIWLQDFHRTGGNRDFTFGKGSNKILRMPRPGERSSGSTEDWTRPACECLRVSCGGVGQQWLTVGMEALVATVLEGAPWLKTSWRSPLTNTPHWAHRIQGWIASGQNNNREGKQLHLSADNCIQVLLSTAPSTRARPNFPHYQSLPSGSLYKPLSLIHQRIDRRSKKNHNPSQLEPKPYHKKLTRMKKQRALSQMKGQDIISEKQPNEVEIGSLLEKKFRIMTVKMIQDLGNIMEKMQ